jgi:hypothetical protein
MIFGQIAYGQADQVLDLISSKLPKNWNLMLNENTLTIASKDSISIYFITNIPIEPQKTLHKSNLKPSTTPVITFQIFDITNREQLNSTIDRIENLRRIINNQEIKCFSDPCDLNYKFVQFKNLRGDKRATKKLERSIAKRQNKCGDYDEAKFELEKLQKLTPLHFSEKHAFGLPKNNWTSDECESWKTVIEPTELEDQIILIQNILKSEFRTRPNK